MARGRNMGTRTATSGRCGHSAGAPGDVSSSADTIAFCYTAPDLAPDRCGTRPPGCDLRGLRSNGRCRLRPTTRRIAGCERERLASTPRQYWPIADLVLQGAWLGIPERPAAGSLWGVDSRAGITIESKDDIRKRRLPSPDRAETAAMLFSGRAQATLHHEHLVARGTYRASVMGEPPMTQRGFLRVKIFRIADGTIVERCRPERSSRCRARSQTCGSRTQRR
jgi:hypothetical protein